MPRISVNLDAEPNAEKFVTRNIDDHIQALHSAGKHQEAKEVSRSFIKSPSKRVSDIIADREKKSNQSASVSERDASLIGTNTVDEKKGRKRKQNSTGAANVPPLNSSLAKRMEYSKKMNTRHAKEKKEQEERAALRAKGVPLETPEKLYLNKDYKNPTRARK